ncbi:hypothetical protein HMPREF1565_3492 [Providencia alcalifaciens RIMD 1656011]|nr:hypothetical protein HMPREF1562_3444 [Providencia alcalifaciens F90-2004]EUC96430.1 hypothetical protein HMPREF1567_3232 [Providencia alcalifaciens PAL-2]EUD03164.1 hypothetical protein HMPREF1565_3492 [Providencia alcalifaciens RIMD 1656011]EUD05992.1 hypothetical protein HMPREF1564_2482 [Providencia alcalifaciens R90-1475]
MLDKNEWVFINESETHKKQFDGIMGYDVHGNSGSSHAD